MSDLCVVSDHLLQSGHTGCPPLHIHRHCWTLLDLLQRFFRLQPLPWDQQGESEDISLLCAAKQKCDHVLPTKGTIVSLNTSPLMLRGRWLLVFVFRFFQHLISYCISVYFENEENFSSKVIQYVFFRFGARFKLTGLIGMKQERTMSLLDFKPLMFYLNQHIMDSFLCSNNLVSWF